MPSAPPTSVFVTWTADPARVVRALGTAAGVVLALGVVTLLARHFTGHHLFGLVRTLNLNGEGNVPAFFSALLLITAAACLAVRALLGRQTGGPHVRHWTALALGFLYLSFDEAATLHELLDWPGRMLLGSLVTGPLRFAWVLFGLVTIVVLIFGFFRFLRQIPARTARFFVLAGALYLGGAVFMEMVTAVSFDRTLTPDLAFNLLIVVEEGMEMSGVLVLIYAVLDDLQSAAAELRVHFDAPSPPA